MKIILKSIQLTNFKGIRSLIIPFNDDITNIQADNGLGKSTISDAIQWVLFGKDCHGSTDFGIKTYDNDNVVIPKLDHEVTAVMDVDETPVILRRLYKEKWVKPRGAIESEMQGHTTDFFINDVPYQAKEYSAYIGGLVNENLFKAITNPTHFNSLKWEQRRETLIKIAGGFNEQDIIGTRKDFTELFTKINSEGKTLEKFKAEINAKKKVLKEELAVVPGRIDEVSRMIIEEPDYTTIEAEIVNLDAQIAEIDKQIEDKASAGNELMKQFEERLREITALKSKCHSIRTTLQEENQRQQLEKNRSVTELQNTLVSLTEKNTSVKKSIGEYELKATALTQSMDAKRTEWAVENEKGLVFEEGKFVCPACKRKLEDSDIESQKSAMTASFNTDKQKKLSAISAEGGRMKAEKELIEQRIKELESQLISIPKEIAEVEKKISDIHPPEMSKAFDLDQACMSNKDYISAQDKINELESQPEPPKADITDLKTQKFNISQQIDAEKQKMSVRETIKQNRLRLEELSDREKTLAQQIADLEKMEFVMDAYNKALIDSVTDKINSMFRLCKFKMFETQINGQVVPCCETLINGVPYYDANTASKINAGIDIINTLSEYYQVWAPIFVDNAESVSVIMSSKSQMVKLTKVEGLKTLTIS